MPVVNTDQTFNTGDTVTSTSLNNIMDQSVFVSGAVVTGDGLTVTAGGQMTIENLKVTGSKIGDLEISTAKIANDAITTAKIANDAVTQAKLADDSVGSDQIIDASVKASILDGAQTGSAPIFGVRAWVSYDPDIPVSPEFSGTYSRSGTTVTVIAAGHGLKTGSPVYLNFTSGAAADGEFIVTGVSTTTVANDTFTVTHGTSGTTSGNVGIPRATIIGSGNVSSVTLISTGVQVVNFTTEMPSVNYVAVASPEGFASGSVNLSCDIVSKYIGSCGIRSQNSNGLDDSQKTNVMVIG